MKIEVARHHDLDVDVVANRIKNLVAKEQKNFGHLATSINNKWSENALITKISAYGYDCILAINIDVDKISVEAEFPLALALFKKKIIHMIEFRLGRICAPVRTS